VGILLILDEINGISTNPDFAHFVKDLVDSNALSHKPVPLFLMLCGTEERRRQMIRCHQPVERIFEVVDIERLSEQETGDFFTRAFQSVDTVVDTDAMKLMAHYSAGFPKIMHLVGDNAFWVDSDNRISRGDAQVAIMNAAEEVGKKYVDQQVYRALRSKDYHSILRKIAAQGMGDTFLKREVEKGLTETEKRKLNNFLQRMKRLQVLRSGDTAGDYSFNMRMVQYYIWLQEIVKQRR
jgi:hypothetical protein